MLPRTLVLATLLALGLAGRAAAQHDHNHGGEQPAVKPPRIFLDKSPRIVWYQLNRLDNERLLAVERKTDDVKYAPVYTAILTRAGMSQQHRELALAALVTINKSDHPAELLRALETIDTGDREQQRSFRQLAGMLLKEPAADLARKADALTKATTAEDATFRSVGYAGLIAAGQSDDAWKRAAAGENSTLDWLAAVSLVPTAKTRAALRENVVGLLADGSPPQVRRAAIRALAFIPKDQQDTFQLLSGFVPQPEYRTPAVRTLLKIPAKDRDAEVSARLVDVLVKLAETTPAAGRTTDEFVDAMQLADQLMARIPVKDARGYRARLREVTVRVVRIHTVEEEMRYDTAYFAVEAGRDVQVVLQNEDLMPHNFVITVPGALQEVAEAGTALGPQPGFQGKPYVPKSDKVLFATGMVPSDKQERLTFTAPSEPGEYPYVCTFPRHWMRMYGVMVVVKDLTEWQKNPVVPKDPVGSNRPFVKAWSIDDLKGDIDEGLRGRSFEIGQRIFKEASCLQCHKVKGSGGAVGPDLTDVFKRWKGDRAAVLREVLDPSYRIDPKFAVRKILTESGMTITGIVKSEDKTMVAVVDNPEAPKPTVVKRSDIRVMVKTSKSLMPKALLDRFTKDEIFELLAYLKALGAATATAP